MTLFSPLALSSIFVLIMSKFMSPDPRVHLGADSQPPTWKSKRKLGFCLPLQPPLFTYT